MANYCDYTMVVTGTKENCKRFVDIMNNDYDKEHFYRIFECQIEEERELKNGQYLIKMIGDCAWSVYVCMFPGSDTYYIEGSKTDPNARCICGMENSICDELELNWECYSEEPGMGFFEHYKVEYSKETGAHLVRNETGDLPTRYLELEGEL